MLATMQLLCIVASVAADAAAGGASAGGGTGGRTGGSENAFYFSLSLFKNRWFLVRWAEVSVNWVGSCWWLPANDNNRDRGECEQQCSLLIFFLSLSLPLLPFPPFRRICEQKDCDNSSSSSVEGPAGNSSGEWHQTSHRTLRPVLFEPDDSGPTLHSAPTEAFMRRSCLLLKLTNYFDFPHLWEASETVRSQRVELSPDKEGVATISVIRDSSL